jgi:tetratricopeptide (TPR) repeat protein
LADRLGAPDLRTTLDFDRGRLALQNGEHAAAEELLAMALAGQGLFSRPLAHIWRAEALARVGRCDEAEAELRATTMEPMTPGDWPDTLVARMAQVQGLVAEHRGDHALAARRLQEAADGWRRRLPGTDGAADAGERWAAALADIGRPVVGTVEPQVELDAVLADLARVRARDPLPLTATQST